MIAILLLHLAVAATILVAGDRLGRRTFYLAVVAPAVTALWVLWQLGPVTDGEVVVQSTSWVQDLGLTIDLRLDGFSLVMVSLISFVGTAVMVYAAGYFSDRPGLARFAATLVTFAGAMLGLVLSDDLLLLFVFWELTSITSYLLIGFEDEKAAARGAALEAILTTGAGSLVMLAGFVLLGQEAGTYSLSEIVANPPGGTTVEVALVLVLVGAITKSAQVPFHFWLPAAMAAPTPVSAYLHSATMVKAGVYLVARLAPAFADVPVWRPTVLAIGLATMVLGGYRALRQHDLKLVLAFGTVSQLGFLVVLFGAGTPETTFAGVVLIIAHAAFKATLFLVVGAVDHQAHTRDLRRLSGLWRTMPATFVVAAIAAGSMAGLPPLFGFIAKESAYESLVEVHAGWAPVVLAGIVLGSILTFAYSARFLWGAFADKGPAEVDEAHPRVPAPPGPSGLLLVPAACLGATAVLFALVPSMVTPLISEGAHALDTEVEAHGLYLWHGFTAALGLSAVTVAAGALLFVGRRQVERAQVVLHGANVPVAADGYRYAVATLNRVADRVTGVVQSGSLPLYLGIILSTVLVLPGLALAVGATLPDDVRFAHSPLQAAVGLAVVITAVAAARARRRLMAVLLLGGVGYSVAALFLIQGAPDLALTQLLVETLAVVIFALVLRHLPDRFTPTPWRIGRIPRVLVAGGVGVFVTLAALVMAGARSGESISEELVARSLTEAGGKNVVNVILVDFRGFDTMGEITVIAVAALGVLSLVRPGGRGRPDPAREAAAALEHQVEAEAQADADAGLPVGAGEPTKALRAHEDER